MIKLLIVTFSFFNLHTPKDSVGVETINGKVFVIHKVDEKETLYAISRRYHTTVEVIVQYNPSAGSALEIGQMLKVPYTKPTGSTSSTKSGKSNSGGVTHVVADGETLFGISKVYNVSVDEIRQWNNLSDNSLALGQELIIKKKGQAVTAQPKSSNVITPPAQKSKVGAHTVAAGETMFSISKKYNISVQQLKEWNSLSTNEISIGQVLFVSEPEHGVATAQTAPVQKETPVVIAPKQPEPVREIKEVKPQPKETTITITEAVKGSDEIQESGVAELIEGTDGNRKYLALHRTAPIGTILKVKNEMNNREVFVRVMGKLPDIAATDKVIIRVSKSAYDRLGAIDQRFRVQVTYYK
jgi:LysM repeat protein